MPRVEALDRVKGLLKELRGVKAAPEALLGSSERVAELSAELAGEQQILAELSLIMLQEPLCIVYAPDGAWMVKRSSAEKAMAEGLEARAIAVEEYRHHYLVDQVVVSKRQPTVELAKALVKAIKASKVVE